jgi:hypothetical protein
LLLKRPYLDAQIHVVGVGMGLARIIHERFMGLCSAHRKTDEYAANVAESLHYQLDTLKIEFPLFINKTRLRE